MRGETKLPPDVVELLRGIIPRAELACRLSTFGGPSYRTRERWAPVARATGITVRPSVLRRCIEGRRVSVRAAASFVARLGL